MQFNKEEEKNIKTLSKEITFSFSEKLKNLKSIDDFWIFPVEFSYKNNIFSDVKIDFTSQTSSLTDIGFFQQNNDIFQEKLFEFCITHLNESENYIEFVNFLKSKNIIQKNLIENFISKPLIYNKLIKNNTDEFISFFLDETSNTFKTNFFLSFFKDYTKNGNHKIPLIQVYNFFSSFLNNKTSLIEKIVVNNSKIKSSEFLINLFDDNKNLYYSLREIFFFEKLNEYQDILKYLDEKHSFEDFDYKPTIFEENKSDMLLINPIFYINPTNKDFTILFEANKNFLNNNEHYSTLIKSRQFLNEWRSKDISFLGETSLLQSNIFILKEYIDKKTIFKVTIRQPQTKDSFLNKLNNIFDFNQHEKAYVSLEDYNIKPLENPPCFFRIDNEIIKEQIPDLNSVLNNLNILLETFYRSRFIDCLQYLQNPSLSKNKFESIRKIISIPNELVTLYYPYIREHYLNKGIEKKDFSKTKPKI